MHDHTAQAGLRTQESCLGLLTDRFVMGIEKGYRGTDKTSPGQLFPKTVDTFEEERWVKQAGSQAGTTFGKTEGEAESEQPPTCDEGPCRHLAVIGACGGQSPDGSGAEGCPVPRWCGVRTRGKGLEQRAS